MEDCYETLTAHITVPGRMNIPLPAFRNNRKSVYFLGQWEDESPKKLPKQKAE